MKKFIVLLLMIVIWQVECKATYQKSDILIWNNDTLKLSMSPLENLTEVCEKIRGKEKYCSSGCWNGFTAEWILIEDILYLKNIYSYSTGKNINKLLEKLLKRKFVDGRIKADWFTGNFYGGFGRELFCLYYSVYEKERHFEFIDGLLKKSSKFDAKNIEYSIDKDEVKEFIYANFNWDLFDSKSFLHKRATVFLEANNLGQLTNVEFEESAGKKIDSEIEKVIRLIPNWGVYYNLGETHTFFDEYSLEFNNEIKKKYER